MRAGRHPRPCAHTHTHSTEMCNNYSFSTVTMLWWTRLSVTLLLRTLPVLRIWCGETPKGKDVWQLSDFLWIVVPSANNNCVTGSWCLVLGSQTCCLSVYFVPPSYWSPSSYRLWPGAVLTISFKFKIFYCFEAREGLLFLNDNVKHDSKETAMQ